MEREKFPVEQELDKPREKCGIVGIYGQSADIAIKTFDALSELQHRGQQAAGITVFNEHGAVTHKKPGKVKEKFTPNELAGFGEGHIGVGHVRYQTVDTPVENVLDSIQPLSDPEHSFVVAHNGNFTHFDKAPFKPNGQSDTAHFKDLIHNSLKSQLYPYLPYAVKDAVYRSEGAYSLIIADQDHLIAVRDKWGFRPLVYGQQADGTYVAASESVALDALGIDEYRYLEPGQMLIVDKNGPRLEELEERQIGAFCMMELVYFSRPDTMYGAESVYTKRVRTGERLAEEAPADVDVVVGVPGTGLDAAKGYAERLGLPFMEKGIHKTGYERSF